MDIGGLSPGTQLNRMLDGLGFPDKLGDMYGAALDSAVGNQLGVARNLFDAFSPLSTRQLDRMSTGGFSPMGFAPRPFLNFGQNFGSLRPTFYDRESISVFKEPGLRGAMGHQDVMIDGKKIDVGKDKGLSPQKLEAKILTDPAFRAKIEGQVGGRIVLDGKADGNITIAKRMPHPMIPYQNSVHRHIGSMLQRAFNPPMLGNVLGQLGNFLGQTLGGGVPGAAGGAGGAGGAQGAQSATQQQLSNEISSILKNPNLSFEAKLAQFMMKFMEKKQDEINQKMEQMEKQQSQAQQGGGQGGKKGGGGGKKGGGGKGLGSLLQMGGGLIGGMYGGPLGAGMGQQIGGMLGGAAGGGGGQGGAGGTSGKGKSEQLAMKELETAMQQFQKMMESMTNVMKSIQDMTMSSARNIRG